jgi:lipoprotein NlpD
MGRYLYLTGLLVLAACGSRPPVQVVDGHAPVAVEARRGAAPGAAREGYYVVKKGDTLYRIAQTHGVEQRDVAAWNNLTDLTKLEVGQELRMTPPEGAVEIKPIAAPAPIVMVGDSASSPVATRQPVATAVISPSQGAGGTVPATAIGATGGLMHEPKGGKVAYSETALAQVREMEGGSQTVKPAERPLEKPTLAVGAPAAIPSDSNEWTWPLAGKMISEFVEGGAGKESNKGIDLAGRVGEPIQAAAAGKVSFVGNLRGYGDFLVLQHNGDFISVYAHTSKILVKKDQPIAKGQKIAEVGRSDSDVPKLHFEIRSQGKPIDPLKLLPPRQ